MPSWVKFVVLYRGWIAFKASSLQTATSVAKYRGSHYTVSEYPIPDYQI